MTPTIKLNSKGGLRRQKPHVWIFLLVTYCCSAVKLFKDGFTESRSSHLVCVKRRGVFKGASRENVWYWNKWWRKGGGGDCFLTNGLICMTAVGKLNTEWELLLMLGECEVIGLSGTKQRGNKEAQKSWVFKFKPNATKTILTESPRTINTTWLFST